MQTRTLLRAHEREHLLEHEATQNPHKRVYLVRRVQQVTSYDVSVRKKIFMCKEREKEKVFQRSQSCKTGKNTFVITTCAPRGPPPPPLSSCALLRRRRLYEQMLAVPAAASHSFGVGCLHPMLDRGLEPLEAKVREGRHTLV